MSRSNYYISRDTSAIDTGSREPSWFADFVANLEKESVKSKKDDYSLFDQINSILGNKSKYSTTEEAILDMQKRTGLLDVLNKKKEAQQAIEKKYEKSNFLNSIPAMKTFINNYVEDRPGTSVDAVIHDLLRIQSIKDKLPEGDDVPEEIKRYINDKILESNLNHPVPFSEDLELGKLDLSTDDNTSEDNNPFLGCTPARNNK
jgi:hypothetical protein